MKKIFAILILVLSLHQVQAQSFLLDPNAAGGFQLGTTFAANGWVEVNGTQVNKWTISTNPNGFNGNVAHISPNAGTTNSWDYAFTNTSVVHIYRDVTIPAGQTQVDLSFKWKAQGEEGLTTFNEALMVSVAPTTFTPATALTNGFLPSPARTIAVMLNDSFGKVENIVIPPQLINNCSAASTIRLIFTWKNNNSIGVNPPAAIDSVSIISDFPSGPALTTGVFTINNTLPSSGNNFNSFTDAVNYLNTRLLCSSLSNPLQFNVASGQSFFENVPPLYASGTASFPITFQKSGSGPNPIIFTQGNSVPSNFGFCFNGSDFITMDGIHIIGDEQTEFGFLIRNASATNGCENITLKNFYVSLDNQNINSKGVLISSSTGFSSQGLTPTAISGSNSGIVLQDFVIEKCIYGVYGISGSATYPDLNLLIGTANCSTYNTIGGAAYNDIGGETSAASGGIYLTNQRDPAIFNTIIRNISSTGGINGIFTSGSQGTTSIFRNKIYNLANASNASTSTVTGIYTAYGGPTGSSVSVNVYGNTISNLSTAYNQTNVSGTLLVRGIQMAGSSSTPTTRVQFVENNSIQLNLPGTFTGSSACLNFSNVTASINTIRNNIFSNISAAQTAPGRHAGLWLPSLSVGLAGSSCNYNDYFIPNTGQGFMASTGTLDFPNLTQWTLNTSGLDANSVNINPLFNSDIDLHINQHLLNGIGTTPSAFVSQDIDCQNYAAPFDMGADNADVCNASNIQNIPTGKDKTFYCAGDKAILTTNFPVQYIGLTYQWKFANSPSGPFFNVNGNPTATLKDLITNPLGAGNRFYYNELTCALSGTTAPTLPVQTTTFLRPNVSASKDTLFACGQANDTIQVSGNAVSYSWTVDASTVQLPSNALYTQTTASANYVLTGLNNQGCPATDTLKVLVYPPFNSSGSSTNVTNVCAPGTGNLSSSATYSLNTGLKITELTMFRNGTGLTTPYPAYVGTNDADFIEITNLGNNSVNMSGYQVDIWLANSVLSRTFTVPNGVTLAPSATMVLSTAVGIDDPANHFYTMSNPNGQITSSGPLSSTSIFGVVLRNGNQKLDVVRVGAFIFPPAANVNSLDWQGLLVPIGGRAGLQRITADNNGPVDWIVSSAIDVQTIGALNPGLPTYNTTPSIAYSWSPGLVLNDSTLSNPVFTNVLDSTQFIVTIQEVNSQCKVKDTVLVDIYPTPQIVVSNPAGICQPGSLDVGLNNPMYNGSIIPPGSTLNFFNTNFTQGYSNPLTDSGAYQVVMSTTFCADTASFVATVHTKPDLVVSPQQVLTNCADSYDLTTSPNILLTPSYANKSYFWDAGLSSVVPNPSAVNLSDTVFILAQTPFCSDTDFIEIFINPPSSTISLQLPGFFVSSYGNIACNSLNFNDGDSSVIFDATCSRICSIRDNADGTSLGQIDACDTVYQSGPITYNTQPFAARVYSITPANNAPAYVCLYYTDDDMQAYNSIAAPNWPLLPQGSATGPAMNQVSITKVNGGALGGPNTTAVAFPIPASDISYDAVNQIWQICFNTSGFSDFYLHTTNPGNAPLPVIASPLSAQRMEETVALKWTTYQERWNAGFVIERSLNGRDFSPLSDLIPSQGVNGNSDLVKNYQYTDLQPHDGINYYRYRQVDLNGQVTHSNIVQVKFGSETNISTHPNPVENDLHISIFMNRNANMDVRILDMAGRKVKVLSTHLNKGEQQMVIDLSGLASGMYQLEMSTGQELIYTEKLIKK